MTSVVPIILAGGVGARLWPVSRKSCPKQFAALIGGFSLFQQSVLRVQGDGFVKPLIVTSEEYRFLVSQQLNDLGVDADIVLEPEGKNTAPAIISAAIIAQKREIDPLLLVMPSDHHIPDTKVFEETVAEGLATAGRGGVVTFGVKPTRAETGYGYIETLPEQNELCRPVKGFHEKPDYSLAVELYTSGLYLWNTGIFLFEAKTILALARRLQPQMLSVVVNAVENGSTDLGYFRISTAEWTLVKADSIDFAIMEKADNIFCINFRSEWSDLGDWLSIANLNMRDSDNNTFAMNTTGVDCKNTMLWSSTNKLHLAGLGLENIVAVATDDAVLVAHADRLQEVRKVLTTLELQKVPAATKNLKDCRPWGWFESLLLMPSFQVKRLHIYPRSTLSLQTHKYRAEHWVVVSGRATVCKGEDMFALESNESVYIEAGQKHRLANETDEPLSVIEVQTGSYLGEDDIIRHEDVYHRSV